MTKKRSILTLTILILGLLLFLQPNFSLASSKEIQVTVNGALVHFNDDLGHPEIVKDRTMVPIRIISEEMGYDVKWGKANRVVTIENDDKKVEFKIGDSYALVNGVKTPIDKRDNGQIVDTKAYIKNDRTYVPLRFISEALGAKVGYRSDDYMHYIDITTVVYTDKDVFNPKVELVRYPNPGTPFALELIGAEEFDDDEIKAESKILAPHDYLNTITEDDLFSDERFTVSGNYQNTGLSGPSPYVYELMAGEMFNAVDGNGNKITKESLKGKTFRIWYKLTWHGHVVEDIYEFTF